MFKISDSLGFLSAALIEPLAVAIHDVKSSGLKLGETVAIIGGGPIGLLIALVARFNGASKIVLSEVNPARIRKAKEMGFEVINAAEVDTLAESLKITDGKGFDVVFEVSGSRIGTAVMTDIVKTSGRVVIVGIPAEKYPVNTDSVFKKEINIIGVRLYSKFDFESAVRILESPEQRKAFSQLITAEYPIERISEAFQFILDGNDAYKVMVKVS